MTLRADRPLTIGNLTVELICDVTCQGTHSSGSYWFTGAKKPVALIIDDGIRRTAWRLPGSPKTEELVQRAEAELV